MSPLQVLPTAAKAHGARQSLTSGGAAEPGFDLAVRVYESAGTPVTAAVSSYGGLRAAHRTGLLEARDLSGLTVHSGQTEVDLNGADVATVRLVPAPGPVSVATVGPVEPICTRYWRHTAPLDNLRVTVHMTADPAAHATLVDTAPWATNSRCARRSARRPRGWYSQAAAPPTRSSGPT